MNTGDCLYIYRQMADGNGRGNCKLLCIAESCYIQLADAVGKKQQKAVYISVLSVGRQIPPPPQPAKPRTYMGRTSQATTPRQPPEVTGFYSQGLLLLPPILILGIKKRMHLAPFSTFYSICLESVTFKTGQQLQCYSTYTISLQLLPILYQLYCYPLIPFQICQPSCNLRN